MSLAHDAASGSQGVGGDPINGYVISYTHTPVGTPKVVTVNVVWHQQAASTGAIYLLGITYGGQAMTFIGTSTEGTQVFEKWILLSPPSGAQTVEFTWYDGDSGSSTAVANSMTYTASVGVNYGTLQLGNGTASPITKTVTGVAATSILDTMGGVNNGSSSAITITVNGTAETKRSGVTAFGLIGQRGQVYNSNQTGSGSVTANATESASRNWRILVIELKEAANARSHGYIIG